MSGFEVLGLAAGVVQLVEISRLTASRLGDLIAGAASAPVELLSLKNELTALEVVLKNFVAVVQKNPASLSSLGIDTIRQTLESLNAVMISLDNDITQQLDSSRLRSSLRWKVKAVDMDRYRAQIDSLKASVMLILTVVETTQAQEISKTLADTNAQLDRIASIVRHGIATSPHTISQASILTVTTRDSRPAESPVDSSARYTSRMSPRHRRCLEKVTFGAGDKYHFKLSKCVHFSN